MILSDETRAYLGAKLVKCVIRMFELIPEFAYSPQEAVAFCQVFRRLFGSVQAAPEPVDILVQPGDKFFSGKTILILPE